MATATWQILGITDERDVCELCGKVNLKKVVVLTDGDAVVYVGTECAATLANRSAAYVARKAASAARAASVASNDAEWAAIVDAQHYRFLKNVVFTVSPDKAKFELGLRKIVEQTGLPAQTIIRHLEARWGTSLGEI